MFQIDYNCSKILIKENCLTYDWTFSPKMKNLFSESGQKLFCLKRLLLSVAFFQNLLLVIKCNFGWSWFITLTMMSERLVWRSWSSSLWKLHPCIKLCKKKVIKTSLNTRRCQRDQFWIWMYIYKAYGPLLLHKTIYFLFIYAVELKRQISQHISFWNGCCPVWTGQWSKPYWNIHLFQITSIPHPPFCCPSLTPCSRRAAMGSGSVQWASGPHFLYHPSGSGSSWLCITPLQSGCRFGITKIPWR